MLKQIERKLSEAVKSAALKDFDSDFDALGNQVNEVFEKVRIKLGDSIERVAPAAVVLRETRQILVDVRAIIAGSEELPGQDSTGAIRTKNQAINRMARGYLNIAEAKLADRLVRSVEGLDEPEESKFYQTECPELWTDFVGRAGLRGAPRSPSALDMTCPSCKRETEGYLRHKHGKHFVYFRCVNPACEFASKITALEVMEIDGKMLPSVHAIPYPPHVPEPGSLAEALLSSLISPVWREYRLEVKYADLGLKSLGYTLAYLSSVFGIYCPLCGCSIEGYAVVGQAKAYIRWRCTQGGCSKSQAIQVEEIAIES